MFTGVLFYAYVGSDNVWMLIFDLDQCCVGALKKRYGSEKNPDGGRNVELKGKHNIGRGQRIASIRCVIQHYMHEIAHL